MLPADTRVSSVLYKVFNVPQQSHFYKLSLDCLRELTPQPDCLTKNSYKEAKCQNFIDALYECCDAFYQKNGEDATTASCPKAHLLRLKMKQRQEERNKQ